MEKKKLDADRAILVPADEGAVEIGVAAAPDPRLLQAVLTVTTADWGQFVIPLSANHVGLLVAWGKTFLNLTPEQVANLRDELNTPERNEDE